MTSRALPDDGGPGRSPYREPTARPLPPRPVYVVLVVLALIAACLVAFTSHKLYVMAQLRGDIAGIPTRDLVLRHSTRRYGEVMTYLLTDPSRPDDMSWHIQLTSAQFDEIGQWSLVRVRCLETDHSCYLRGSVYIDDGNRAFDLVLLGLEILGFVACTRAVWKRRRAWQDAVRASAVRK